MSNQCLENIANRYDRQELIQGWNQEKLKNSRIAIIGNNILANYSAITLASLGFGTIEIFGNGVITNDTLLNFRRNNLDPDYSSGFLYFDSNIGDVKSEVIAEFIKKFNPLVDSYGVNIDMCKSGNMNLLNGPDIIIETTNDPASKIEAIEYSIAKKIPIISMSSNEIKSSVGMFNPNSRIQNQRKFIENIIFAEYNNKKQGTNTSQVISGLAIDEARKYLMPLENEKIIDDIVVYNLESNKRFNQNRDHEITGQTNLKNKTVLMIGAGAEGNHAGLEFALSNVGQLYIVDFDEVESTNLNRQIWFYDSVGQIKSEALVNKLKKINPRIKYIYSKNKITPESEDFFKKAKIDLMVDTVDNNKTRALLNYFSLKYNIPFISGGTSYNSGQVVTSVPGVTACLNCQVNIDDIALNAYTPNQSCIYAPQASVINSNQIMGGIIGGEARTILQPNKFGPPIQLVLKYVGNEDFRLATLPSQEPCKCYKNRKLLRTWMNKMNHLYTG